MLVVKNPPANADRCNRRRFDPWEDPLEEEMATHSSILAHRIPMDRGAWWATVHRVTKSWTRLSDLTFTFFSFSQQYVAVRKPAFPSRVRKGYEQSNEFRRIQKLTLPGPTLLSSQ